VAHLVDALNDAGERQVTRVSPGAMAVLRRYAWPGNVRELRNALEYAFVIGERDVIGVGDLPEEIVQGEPAEPTRASLPDLERAAGHDESPADAVERARIVRALSGSAGHLGRAARALGVSRTTLWRHMKRLGLEEGS
jgi:two-component system response regulator AtoC